MLGLFALLTTSIYSLAKPIYRTALGAARRGLGGAPHEVEGVGEGAEGNGRDEQTRPQAACRIRAELTRFLGGRFERRKVEGGGGGLFVQLHDTRI